MSSACAQVNVEVHFTLLEHFTAGCSSLHDVTTPTQHFFCFRTKMQLKTFLWLESKVVLQEKICHNLLLFFLFILTWMPKLIVAITRIILQVVKSVTEVFIT
jgi:hypothetical protein